MPGQTERAPDLDTFFHITDSTATILDLAHIAPPSDPAPPLIDPATGINKNAGKVIYDGRYVYPITGLSMVDHLEGRRQIPRMDRRMVTGSYTTRRSTAAK
jgi:arylsulfatase